MASTSGESSDSESDNEETEAPLDLNPNETSDKVLTLVDNENPELVVQLAPEDTCEGEEEGEEKEDDGVSSEMIFSQEPEKPKRKKRKRKRVYFICLTNCKYDSVRRVAKRFGFREVGEEEDWNLFWTDLSVSLERVMDMKRYQKINHFPGMSEICRKDFLARNLNRMLKLFPKDYNIFPRSWCLPADFGDFQAHTRQKKHRTYILKPDSGCQGKGIWVTRNPRDIKPHEHMLCQQYLSKPFLIDGFKFDLRIYTLVTSVDPLRIFVFKDGLVRFATHKYMEPTNSNIENQYMHLTNYSINKSSKDFVRNDDEGGSKRRITTVNRYLADQGHDIAKVWKDIDDVIIKTIISAMPTLRHNYRTCFPNHVRGSACFEISGFDIILDKKLKPFVLEVNHSPSFHTDAKLDKEIKEALLFDTMTLLNFGALDKKKIIDEERRKIKDRLMHRQSRKESKEDLDKAQQKWQEDSMKYEDAHLGNFRRIYPAENTEKYDKFFQTSGSLYQETAACKARSECARQQREEILRRQEKLDAILKKKNLVRPESPETRRRKLKRNYSVSTRHSNSKLKELLYQRLKVLKPPTTNLAEPSQSFEPLDTSQPQDIVAEEEVERLSALLQRDNLVRGLGVVECVYRLLHSSPGAASTSHLGSRRDRFRADRTNARRLPALSLSLDGINEPLTASRVTSAEVKRVLPSAETVAPKLPRAYHGFRGQRLDSDNRGNLVGKRRTAVPFVRLDNMENVSFSSEEENGSSTLQPLKHCFHHTKQLQEILHHTWNDYLKENDETLTTEDCQILGIEKSKRAKTVTDFTFNGLQALESVGSFASPKDWWKTESGPMEDISTRMSALDFAESHVHKAMNSASLQGNNNSNSTYSAIVPLQQVFNLQTTKYQSSYGNWKSSRSSRGTYNVGDRSFQGRFRSVPGKQSSRLDSGSELSRRKVGSGVTRSDRARRLRDAYSAPLSTHDFHLRSENKPASWSSSLVEQRLAAPSPPLKMSPAPAERRPAPPAHQPHNQLSVMTGPAPFIHRTDYSAGFPQTALPLDPQCAPRSQSNPDSGSFSGRRPSRSPRLRGTQVGVPPATCS